MTWTPGVSDDDARVMIRAIEDIYDLMRGQFGKPGQFDPLPVVRIFGAWMIPSLPPDAAYANVGYYVERSLDDTRDRILGSRYLDLVRLEPWQSTSPHFDLAMTNLKLEDDLETAQASRRAKPGMPALKVDRPGLLALISTFPFDSIESQDLRRLAIRHMVAHAFGRLMGIPRRGRTEAVIQHLGDRYCANTCAMRLTDTPTLALSFAQQELASGVLYCDLCKQDLASQITGFHYGMN